MRELGKKMAGMRWYWCLVALVVIGLGLEYVTEAEAGRLGTDEVYGVNSFYDEVTSVYCATRLKAISCVHVPRDSYKGR